VADSGYASLQLLANCRRFLPKPVTFITRLRLDAALYNPALSRRAGQMDRPGLKCERLPNPAVVAEDPSTAWVSATVDDWSRSGEHTGKVASATAVWYSIGLPAVPMRCVLEREPQGAFAAQALPLVTLLAHQRIVRNGGAVRHAAWYRKFHPTFADALVSMRKELWSHATFCESPPGIGLVKERYREIQKRKAKGNDRKA
jgi:hypothetical protein